MMSLKVPLTCRIRPDLETKIVRSQAEGMSKTEVVENALDLYYKTGSNYGVSLSPECLDLIRSVVREEFVNIVKFSAWGYPFNPDSCDAGVIPDSCDAGVIPDSCDAGVIPDSCDDPVINDAFVLVSHVREIMKRDDCGLKKACKIAGFSDKKYYSRLKLLPDDLKQCL